MSDFPLLKSGLVYLDNAATTQKPQVVIDAITNFYTTMNANIHRGVYQLSADATNAYDAARESVAKLLNVPSNQVIFTSGTTAAINGVAQSWGLQHLKKGDEILLTPLEHHANIVPWQHIASVTGAQLVYGKLREDASLDLDDLVKKMGPRTKLLAVTHVSNVLGIASPLERLLDEARGRGIVTMVDGAQAVPHGRVDLSTLRPDFYAFSGHKMLGPTGIGVLYMDERHLTLEPWAYGGDMIDDVTDNASVIAVGEPRRFEAGTQHLAGAVGLAAAVNYLNDYGWETLRQQEDKLLRYAWKRLTDAGATLYGPAPDDDPLVHERAAVISFNLDEIHPHDVGTILDEQGIAIRTGQHCAHPLMNRLGVSATCRASFYLYNSTDDVVKLVAGLEKVREVFR